MKNLFSRAAGAVLLLASLSGCQQEVAPEVQITPQLNSAIKVNDGRLVFKTDTEFESLISDESFKKPEFSGFVSMLSERNKITPNAKSVEQSRR